MIESVVYAILIVLFALLSISFGLALVWYLSLAALALMALTVLWLPLAIGMQYGCAWGLVGIVPGLMLSWLGATRVGAYLTSQLSDISR